MNNEELKSEENSNKLEKPSIAKPESEQLKETPKKTTKENKETKKRRSFPTTPFEEAFIFSKEVFRIGVGQKVRRLTVFGELDKSPDSGPSRVLVITCGKYGLLTGGYKADYLELTSKGKIAVNEELNVIDQVKAKVELAILDIDIYKKLYERLISNKLPSSTVIGDIAKELEPELNDSEIGPIIDTFIVNLKYLGLLKSISGAERVISVDFLLDELPKNNKSIQITGNENLNTETISPEINNESFDNICFYVAPIGDEESEFRKHSDLMLGSIIEPALIDLKLKVVRADKISKPGMITKQIVEYILKSKLLIADLSFHNPNVFYELALRHACRLPTVQIIRKADYIPFDLSQSRTIVIDTTDIYSLVPQMEIYKSEISAQARQALADPDSVDNPVINVFPKLRLE